ncbi:MAG: M16 family metallopeptidase [Candidatus Aminicenantia bacterium]
MKKLIVWLFSIPLLLISPIVLNANENSFIFNSLRKSILDNGVTLIYQQDLNSQLTAVGIFIKGGRLAEPEGKSGISYLTTRLASELTAWSDIEKIATMGSRISATSSFDYSLITIQCISDNLGKTIEILSKSFTKPLFSGLRINGIKQYMIGRIKSHEDEPWLLIDKLHYQLRFGNKGYGNSIYGSEESLKSIKKNNIKNFYEKFFRGGNIVVSIVSDLEFSVINKIIKKYFLKLPPGKSEISAEIEIKTANQRKEFYKKERKQSLILISFPFDKINRKNFALVNLINTLFGKGTNSRLWFLRQKEKLAYSVRSKASQMKESGTFSAYIEIDHHNQDKAIELLRNEFEKLRKEGISKEELEITKINSVAYFLRETETKLEKAFAFGYFETLGLDYDYANKFIDEIAKVTTKEINDFINTYFILEKEIEIIIGKEKSLGY